MQIALEELLHGQAVGCSENASTVPNAATPARMTAKEPGISLFISSTRLEVAQLE